jgi:hypothetical protein
VPILILGAKPVEIPAGLNWASLAASDFALRATTGQDDPTGRGTEMYNVMKIFILAAAIMVVAFFANLFGFVSIPWLDVNSVATYGDDANESDRAAQKVFED